MSDTVYLKDYKPPVFEVTTISLAFDLYDDHALVINQMQLRRQHPGDLYLYGVNLELISIDMNGQPLPPAAYQQDSTGLSILNCPDELRLTIMTRIFPQNNTALSGLYCSQQLFCTQCEAEGFRHMTFFPDHPDVLAIYATRISADKAKYPVLLSNGNLLDSGETADGRHWVVWQDPFRKPSYLFALVAGNLLCVKDTFTTCTGRTISLNIYIEPGNEDKCAHAMHSLKNAMRWDEEEYGREYDLDTYMIVAVRDFNMGAMENKGLNIFNSKCILGRSDTATDNDFITIESVVAHEYFHNWTGNRVTLRDWFQLSLKEGLTVFREQMFSSDMNSHDVNRIEDVKILRNSQFPEDLGSMAHPVRPGSYQEINNFYTATVYNKGAEVIRMQHTLLGKAGFRRGMDLYFQRHDGQAVTIDDFVAAMEDANKVDFTQLKRWYSQAGTPEVNVVSNYHKGRLTLSLTQTCRTVAAYPEKKPFHIPIRIALFSPRGKALPLDNNLLELREAEQTFHFDGLKEKPIVSLLQDFSAPIILKHQASQDELLTLLRCETNGFSKWDVAQRLALSCLSSFYQSPVSNWRIPEALIDAYRHVLTDDSLDCALRAELLTPPGFEDLLGILSNTDVSRLMAARDFFRAQLGQGLFAEAKATYESLWNQEDHAMHGQAYGRRQLRNTCLWFMMKADEASTVSICQNQFSKAAIMTDKMTSFGLLANASDPLLRKKIIQDFYGQWKKNELVLDKWFMIQATCELPDTLKHVRVLLTHPDFDIKNPNKVRALVGAFCQSNPRHFHAADGSGYEFLTEMLIKLDKINPQITARLAIPFTQGSRLDAGRQALIKQQLERLAAVDLSRDLREVVSKSLE